MTSECRKEDAHDLVRKARLLAALALLGLLLAPRPALGQDVVRLHLKWLHGAQFAGYYAAVDQGFYEDENIVVEFIEGATDYQEFLSLADGDFDFLVGDALRLLQAVDKSVPVVAVAAIYQFDPLVLFSLAENGIKSPYDLVGHSIMSLNSVLLEALLGRIGLSMDDVDAGGTSYDVSELWDGKYDVWMGYLINEVVLTRDAGFEVNVIYPTDYGVHVYGDALVTREALAEENPDLILRFLKASLRGWEYVSRHPVESAGFALNYNAALQLEHEIHAVEASLPLLHGGVANIGWMSLEKWSAVAALMLTYGRIDTPVDAGDVFTLRFLEGVYSQGDSP